MIPPPDPSWTTPDASLTGKIEAAEGMLAERFAFCQTMPLDEFVKVAESLRQSGYRPIRFRPYADGEPLRVAVVWTRDGRPWRLAHDQWSEEIRQTDEQNRKEQYLPVEVAGYAASSGYEGKVRSRFAALWTQRTGPDDDARLVVAPSSGELTGFPRELVYRPVINRQLVAPSARRSRTPDVGRPSGLGLLILLREATGPF
jgi:hypothetical protein